jgi:hypothetical protein
MNIGDRRVVQEYSKNKAAQKGEILESELTEDDITFEVQEKVRGKSVTNKYKLGGLHALDLNFRDFYDIHDKTDPDKSFKGDAVPLLKWLSIVGRTQVDFAEAKRQGREKGDGKGPWPSSMQDTEWTKHYILFTNDIVNNGFFDLQNHPRLQWYLMSMVGVGEMQEHQWLPVPHARRRKSKVDELLLRRFPTVSRRELEMLKEINTEEDIRQLARGYALDDKEIKAIVDDFKKWQDEQASSEDR